MYINFVYAHKILFKLAKHTKKMYWKKWVRWIYVKQSEMLYLFVDYLTML
jgi:hypothetical protein